MNINRRLSEPPVCRMPARNRRADWIAAVGVFAVVFIVHFGSLSDGLFFDDHWHRATLRTYGWGFNDLVESATFDLPGRLVNLWWQEQPLEWRYARPAAMFFMKLELILTGGSPMGIHACALLWHAGASFFVYLCALWVLRKRWWAFIAAVTFAIQPHSVFGISWIAARNAVVSGFFFLAAFYAYASAEVDRNGRPISLGTARILTVLILWGLSLFSRESAVVFCVLVPLLDLTRGGLRLILQRVYLYGLIWLLTGAYLYWRLVVFPVAGPPSIYYTSPDGLMYPVWAACKLLHMLFALVFQTPMFLGLATYDSSIGSQVAIYAVMAVLLAAMTYWYIRTSTGLRTRWFWPLWVGGAFVPVIPVFVMPHFAYLPAAAFSVMLGVMLARLRKAWRGGVSAAVIVATLWSVFVYRTIWRGVVRSEQLIYADISDNTPSPEPGAKLFFINLPVSGIYAPVAMRERWAQPDLDGYVLTFARQPLMMRAEFTVEKLNEYELELTTESPGYFSGLSGRMLLDGMRDGDPLRQGDIIRGDIFDTTIVEAGDGGVTRLRFTFERPLDSPDYYFYISSPERPAARLNLEKQRAALYSDWRDLFVQARSADAAKKTQARLELAQRLLPAAVEYGSSIQKLLQFPDSLTEADVDAIESWTRDVDAPRLLEDTADFKGEYASWLHQRAWYFRISDIASSVLRSDLYLTGDDSN